MQASYEELYAKLKESVAAYQTTPDFDLLDRAFSFARDMHKGQRRESGEPYITHPLEVALILTDMEMDMEAIVAGLLHDIIEDTPVLYEDIKNQFSENIALLVEGVTKLDRIKFTDKAEQQIESLRKMFLAMAKDIRVILIKLADRLHNMRTLKNMPPEKRLIKARETLEVYAPLAHRLGISKIKWELEDLALRHLDSVAYYEIVESINKKRIERDAYIEKIKEALSERLTAMNIHFEIEGRAKNFYSIYKKMYTQNKSIDEIYDLFAVRIIVNTVSDCYTVLGMVHELYVPIPGRFKDYIAMPKPNMYQSLHTTVMGPEGSPCEIQIRTFEMHRTAEHGIAAHWKYKEGKTGKDAMDAKFSWIRQLLEIQKDLTDEEEFMRTLKIDLFTDEVFAFTPRGDVINLPAGSTPIDFAFAIHSAVGSKMMGAKVNSKIVPLDYQLATGDIVEILTSASVHGPSRDWLKICKTNQARSKINSWLKKEMREENIVKGKELLDRELKRQGYTHEQLCKKAYMDQCLRRYSFANTDDMYAALGYGTITSLKIITRLKEYHKEAVKDEEIKIALEPLKKPGSNSSIVVRGIDNCLVRVSKCCMPIPGDAIVGYITKGRGVSVHRADCVNVQPSALSDEDKGRLIECYWGDDQKGSYLSDIQIESTDRQTLLADILNALTEYKLSISAFNSRSQKNKMAIINLTVEVNSAEQLNMVIKRLYTVPGVFNIIRLHQ
ncbi:MAG: bifunctional (p)ppGpp synthetase/guanosine-3',5'-bis(diphosphate) 3'-pyrophosphohydrolase [Clostridia bacterium]|nr:bifunctional (p)ppGpp synthetase/guanosine-3',5'-bis(diphosphate) 3'-pyrophosphohydrolase [Clostridia bacterium]